MLVGNGEKQSDSCFWSGFSEIILFQAQILEDIGILALQAEFSEPAPPRQSTMGPGRLGREADLRVTSTNLLFGFFENLSQNSLLY